MNKLDDEDDEAEADEEVKRITSQHADSGPKI